MAPKQRGSANTNVGESSNPGVMQVDKLAKMIQGYEEKNNATAEMMMEMRKMFDEKFQALEKENNALKQKARKSGQSKTERDSISQSRKTREESEIKQWTVAQKAQEARQLQARKLSAVARKPANKKEEAISKEKKKRQRK